MKMIDIIIQCNYLRKPSRHDFEVGEASWAIDVGHIYIYTIYNFMYHEVNLRKHLNNRYLYLGIIYKNSPQTMVGSWTGEYRVYDMIYVNICMWNYPKNSLTFQVCDFFWVRCGFVWK